MYDIIITVGIPLSGKSTFSRFYSKKEGHVVICPDTVRIAIHGNQFIHSAEPHVWATVDTMARTFLLQENRIIIDATNTHKNARSRWIRLAKEFNKTIAAYVIATPFEECYKRNELLKRLDVSILNRMVSQYQYPTKEEGLDAVIGVFSETEDDGSINYIFKDNSEREIEQ